MVSEINKIINRLKEDKQYLIPLLVYTFLFLFFCSQMSPLYPVNDWSDINVYFNMGKAMMNGRVLYTEVFDHKGPLIFIIYGIGYLISNGSFFGVFLIQLVFWFAFMLSVYYTARLFLSHFFSLLVALPVPFAMLIFMNRGGSAEEFILIMASVSLYFFIRHFAGNEKQHKPFYMFIHGVLSCAVLMIKINLIIFWFFPLLAVFIQLLLNKEYKNFLINCVAYLSGVALVAVPILIYFAANGALGYAYSIYIDLNLEYGMDRNLSRLFSRGGKILILVYRKNLLWFVLLTIGIFYFPFRYFRNRLYQTALILAGLSYVGMVFFTFTYSSYYVLPVLVFLPLGLIIVFSVFEKYVKLSSMKKPAYLSTALFTLLCISAVNLYGMGGNGILKSVYTEEFQIRFKQEILKENNPTLLNISYGGTELFTICNIVPNVKYFFTPNLSHELYPDVRNEQEKYIENKDVDFVISSALGFNYSYFEALPSFNNNYMKIDSVLCRGELMYLFKKVD